MFPMLAPTTAASRGQPVAAAMACPAVMVSQETRLSLPSRCSTTTRMVSGIRAVLSSRLSVLSSQRNFASLCSAGRARRPSLPEHFPSLREHLEYSQLVAQFVHQLLRNFPWGAFDVLGLLCFLWNVEPFDLLQIVADC